MAAPKRKGKRLTVNGESWRLPKLKTDLGEEFIWKNIAGYAVWQCRIIWRSNHLMETIRILRNSDKFELGKSDGFVYSEMIFWRTGYQDSLLPRFDGIPSLVPLTTYGDYADMLLSREVTNSSKMNRSSGRHKRKAVLSDKERSWYTRNAGYLQEQCSACTHGQF